MGGNSQRQNRRHLSKNPSFISSNNELNPVAPKPEEERVEVIKTKPAHRVIQNFTKVVSFTKRLKGAANVNNGGSQVPSAASSEQK